ncbi:hypothetical protein [Brunnivagina elsteri]|uniref:Uncharacterized protein n=1 Tax=Brunnivagina elsteri CCALA 953 TaxID=987040 RepID=A0A2A2TLF2_9CYAN|nr:hypothetical protein [Calothrix elsteri]PAX58364.1 hypothetical protein CK510_07795 [Calothrix elsteri CCALA 953]
MLDTSLWQVQWQGNFQAATNGNVYVPIPPIDVPIAFEKPLVAISTSSFNALPKWVTGGWVSQKIYTGLTVTGVGDAIATNQRVFLNKLSLFKFPMDLASTYELTYNFPRWIFDLSIAIWEYQGDIGEVDNIAGTLQRLEEKVDDIATFGGY